MGAGELGGRRAKLAHEYFMSYRAKVPGPNGPAPSAAFEVHNRLVSESRRLPEIGMAGRADLNLIWGARPHDLNKQWLRCEDTHGALARAGQLFTDPAALVQPCPSIPSAPAHALVSKLRPNAVWNDDNRERLIEDRVVFYGTGLLGVSDLVASPTNGPLPGVYTHAMALNNLLSFGDDYKRDRVTLLSGWIALTPPRFEALLAALLAALTVWVYRAGNARLTGRLPERSQARPAERDPAPGEPGASPAVERGTSLRGDTPDRDDGSLPSRTVLGTILWRWAWSGCFVVLSAILLVAGAWFSYDQLNLYPINWIQLLGMYSLLGALANYRAIDQFGTVIARSLRRHAAGFRPD
jgi:hypothetical protein